MPAEKEGENRNKGTGCGRMWGWCQGTVRKGKVAKKSLKHTAEIVWKRWSERKAGWRDGGQDIPKNFH